ncbi:MAG: hypothetical protein LBO72_00410 [Helicobacteraceae bacterium]|jgi:hypothetical protein|nr:hypothetical protein [Helicobacteraceae bacterium]
MKFIKVFAAITIAFSTLFAADENPSALGLQIGAATVADAKAKYRLEQKKLGSNKEGELFEIDVSDIKIDGIKQASIYFDKNGKLALIEMTFSDDKFALLCESLGEKYTTLLDHRPPTGVKSAIFSAGESKIILEQSHLGTGIVYVANWVLASE